MKTLITINVLIWLKPPPSISVYTYLKYYLRQFWEMNGKWIGEKQHSFHDIILKSFQTLKFENPFIILSVFSLSTSRTIWPVMRLCVGLFTLQYYKLIESMNRVLFVFPIYFILMIPSDTEASFLLGVIQYSWMKFAVHSVKA